eukprot:m.454793 g.454793  ORF g.454793 m.454793 type:complete len:138 (+) comp20741_c0_seq1:2684-3097(+)
MSQSLASHRVRKERELRGFAAAILSAVGGVVYFAWAFFPANFAQIVDHTAPDHYWAVAGPMWICVTVAVGFLVYVGMTFYITPASHDINTVVDSHTPRLDADPLKQERVVPRLEDIPLAEVNRRLYGVSDRNSTQTL